MRINIYAEELQDPFVPGSIAKVSKRTDTGQTFFGIRLYLASPRELHDTMDDDDRSAVTLWGPREKLGRILKEMAAAITEGMH